MGFKIINGTLFEYTEEYGVTRVVIPDNVTEISSFAFSGCTSLTSVTIPDSVTSIGESAFHGCTSLTSATIPKCMAENDETLFLSCEKLTNVIILEGAIKIGYRTFWMCKSLTSVTIPNSVTSIGKDAFYGCTSLAEINIPDGVTEIGEYAFDGCTSLTEVNIPNSVTSIGEQAFRGCTSLIEISIPNSVASIGTWAFDGCISLTEINIPNSVTSIGKWAFNRCTSLTSITIPKCVAENDGCGFYDSKSLTNIIILEGATKIGSRIFKGCRSLNSVIIPEGVTSIGEYAFSECENLTEINIPNSVTSIGEGAFCKCTSLNKIHIPEGVTTISQSTFEKCQNLTDIFIPESVTTIGQSAFEKCQNLTEIFIPDGVVTIGEKAFYDCRSLSKIFIIGSAVSIGMYAFLGCPIDADMIVACSEQQDESAKQYNEASEQHDEAFKKQIMRLSSVIHNIYMSKYENNNIVGELQNFQRYLKSYNSSWRRKLNGILNPIIGRLPITKKSDERFKKAIEWTESFFQAQARLLINRMKRFDKVCSAYQESENDLSIINAIADLMNEAVDSLRMEYVFELPMNRIPVTYEIPLEVLEIRGKWNKIRNESPLLALQTQKEELSANTDKLAAAKEALAEKEETSAELSAAIIELNGALSEKQNESVEAQGAIESAQSSLTEAELALANIKTLNGEKCKSLQEAMTEQEVELQNLQQALNAAKAVHQNAKSELEQKLSELQAKAVSLSESIDEYKLRAIKALFFKKKNEQLADYYNEQLAKVNSEIDSIKKQIEQNDALLIEKQADFDRSQEQIRMEMQSGSEQIKELMAEINLFETNLETKQSEHQRCMKQYDSIQKSIAKIQKDITFKQKRIAELCDEITNVNHQIVSLEKKVETLRKDIEEEFLTVFPSDVNERIQEISVSASEDASALERWVASCFASHIQHNSKRLRIEKRWDLLVLRADAEKSFELTERYKETNRLIQETEQEYEKCNGKATELKPYIAKLENEDDYPALLAKVEKKFQSLMKYLSDDFVPPQEIMPFYGDGYCLSMDEDSYLWFCPYYFLLINKQKNKLSVRALRYYELLLAMDTQTVSLDYGEKVPNGFEIMGHHWEYERADGQRNMRYKDNRLRSDVRIYELFISAQNVTKKIAFASDAERLIKCFQEYRNLLFDEKVERIINRIFQCESTPDIIHIHDDVMKAMKADADAKKQAEKEAKAAQLLAQKKEDEAKEAALRKAAEERRIRAEKEKALEEQWLRLQHQMASEEQLVQEKEDILRTAERLLESNCDQIQEKYAAKEAPLDVEAKHRTITNSMTKIPLIQVNTIDCPKYVLWFVDEYGQRISNVRLLEQKRVGETSLIQFELKSQSGFSSSKDYYLCILNFEDGQILGALPFKINISFANDFGF